THHWGDGDRSSPPPVWSTAAIGDADRSDNEFTGGGDAMFNSYLTELLVVERRRELDRRCRSAWMTETRPRASLRRSLSRTLAPWKERSIRSGAGDDGQHHARR